MLSERERAEIEACIESLLAILDAAEGDDDLELNGDEFDEANIEDGFRAPAHDYIRSPGCPISDPDCSADDLGELDRSISPLAPVYGIDQTAQPLNMRAMVAAQYQAETA